MVHLPFGRHVHVSHLGADLGHGAALHMVQNGLLQDTLLRLREHDLCEHGHHIRGRVSGREMSRISIWQRVERPGCLLEMEAGAFETVGAGSRLLGALNGVDGADVVEDGAQLKVDARGCVGFTRVDIGPGSGERGRERWSHKCLLNVYPGTGCSGQIPQAVGFWGCQSC